MHHETLGEIEFDDGFAELEPIGTQDQPIDVLIDGCEREPNQRELDALAEACKSHEAKNELTKQCIRRDYVDLLLPALSVWAEGNPGLLRDFNPDAKDVSDITAEQAANNLRLAEIRLESGDPSQIAFDYRFTLSSEIDYLVCSRFDLDGEMVELVLES